MPIYMKIDGIEGSTSEPGHQGWIILEAANFALHRKIRLIVGTDKARESHIPVFREMTIEKKADKSSPLLFTKACAGKAFPKVLIDVCQTSGGLKPYLQYIMENVIISGYDNLIGGENVEVSEQLKLNYTKITKKYTPRDSAHEDTSPISSSYDLAAAKVG